MVVEIRGNKINADVFKPKNKREFVDFMSKILPYRTMDKESKTRAMTEDYQVFKEQVKE